MAFFITKFGFVKWSTLLRLKSPATEVKGVNTWTINVAIVKLATSPFPHKAMLNNVIWRSEGYRGYYTVARRYEFYSLVAKQ